MTETEWLACDNSTPMLEFTFDHQYLSDRKLRLFACSCCRGGWDGSESAKCRRSVEVAERYADGEATEQQLAKAWSPGRKPVEWLASRCATKEMGLWIHHDLRTDPKVASVSPALLRDLLGVMPFRPVTFCDEWRTDTAVSLARQMYESRDFGAMPILADALQDAGCDNDDILSHCRTEQTHVRGCWVVDLVLGKD